ncbi:MAG: TIGR00282 family metallophosphoesterase, partial [Armatimonadota bacterium]
ANELLSAGIDCLTSGNHVFAKREILPILGNEPRILRPANYPDGAPGSGLGFFRAGDHEVAVINLVGRTFMEPLDCPFRTADLLVAQASERTPFILVDFHAEATSEKIAFGWYMAGRVSAVIGTHTHVQTSDERILPPGTAYITDAGMTGPRDSVLGVRTDLIIRRYLSSLPVRFEVADGPVVLCGVCIELNPDSGRAVSIQRLCVEA